MKKDKEETSVTEMDEERKEKSRAGDRDHKRKHVNNVKHSEKAASPAGYIQPVKPVMYTKTCFDSHCLYFHAFIIHHRLPSPIPELNIGLFFASDFQKCE